MNEQTNTPTTPEEIPQITPRPVRFDEQGNPIVEEEFVQTEEHTGQPQEATQPVQ